MQKQKFISVIIPTRNRNTLLLQVLDGLQQQTVPSSAFSMIVVDDASTLSAAELSSLYPEVTFVRSDVWRGRAATRNAGLAYVQSKHVLFLDDNMVPHPSLLEKHLKASQVGEVVIGYRFQLTRSNSRQAIDNQDMTPDPREEVYAINTCNLSTWHIPWYICQSNNLSVMHDLLQRIGGFDEDFKGWGSEDLDLGYRLQQRGASFVLAWEAMAFHLPHERNLEQGKKTDVENRALLLHKHGTYDIELFLAIKTRKFQPQISIYQLISAIEDTLHTWEPDWLTPRDLPQVPEPCAFFGAGELLQSSKNAQIFHPSLRKSALRTNLLGINVPLPSKYFSSVVLSSLCAQLDDVFWAIIQEARRLALHTFLSIPLDDREHLYARACSLGVSLQPSNRDHRLWKVIDGEGVNRADVF